MDAEATPPRLLRILVYLADWLMTLIFFLVVPVLVAWLDIKALRFVMLAPAMENTPLNHVVYWSDLWLLGAQAVGALIFFALAARTVLRVNLKRPTP